MSDFDDLTINEPAYELRVSRAPIARWLGQGMPRAVTRDRVVRLDVNAARLWLALPTLALKRGRPRNFIETRRG